MNTTTLNDLYRETDVDTVKERLEALLREELEPLFEPLLI